MKPILLCLLATMIWVLPDAGLRAAEADAAAKIQVAAYYFPNWHVRPNARDTAEAFGEWPKLREAIPRYPGHQQPKKPLWGYQNEADPRVMAQKIDAAAEHAVDAFIFCWYPHAAGMQLELALDEGYLKAANRMRVPFALMWANHDVGAHGKGAVSRAQWDEICEQLVRRYFSQPCYWRLEGKCYFSIYQIDTFINGLGGVDQAADALRALDQKARAAGCGGVHLNVIDFHLRGFKEGAAGLLQRLQADSVTSYVWIHLVFLRDFPTTEYKKVQDAYFLEWQAKKAQWGVPYFPNATMGWDPTPRVPPGVPHTGKMYPNTPVLAGNTPDAFREALVEARKRALSLPAGPRVVTIYAWNEWTEGGYLEPDTQSEFGYLRAIRDVFGPAKRTGEGKGTTDEHR